MYKESLIMATKKTKKITQIKLELSIAVIPIVNKIIDTLRIVKKYIFVLFTE